MTNKNCLVNWKKLKMIEKLHFRDIFRGLYSRHADLSWKNDTEVLPAYLWTHALDRELHSSTWAHICRFFAYAFEKRNQKIISKTFLNYFLNFLLKRICKVSTTYFANWKRSSPRNSFRFFQNRKPGQTFEA